jgi:starch phosphorylase
MVGYRPAVPDPRPAPERPTALDELAGNLWSRWDPEARALLAGATADPGREAEAARALERMHGAGGASWFERTAAEPDRGLLVAYLSCEFGVDEELPVYAGGLGVLAGDHLKSSSDLGVPLVGLGLLYAHGYFRQALTAEARQSERYPRNDPQGMPLRPTQAADGGPLEVVVDLAGEDVRLRAWRADVGRVPLYLLDADVEGNSPAARRVTGELYGGDRENRIRQELVLGVGGVRALAVLGLRPSVWHMNEGHSAFLALERLRAMVAEEGIPPDEALERVRAGGVFTTHTPVPAGNEVFADDLVCRYLAALGRELGLAEEELLALGRVRDGDEGFGMTPLALRTSARANGVSRLHGEVARRMWRGLWPERPADRVPIGHVTNGVHPLTWLHPALRELLVAHGARPGDVDDPRLERVREASDADLWRVHRAGVRDLLDTARARGAGAAAGLDPDALTIGFSRRFATYKRPGLLFSRPERLLALVQSADRPVQVILAGKAHPADVEGKEVLHGVAEFARDPAAAGRIVFLADYDIALAQRIVQGVDVWLNAPRPPMEASGTSGMKAGMNGALNLSVLDGWWAEAYAPELGWAIGAPPAQGPDARDEADAEALYALLEDEVVPRFHERPGDRPPGGWLAMMRESIVVCGLRFSSHRMVKEYVQDRYLPAYRDAVRVNRSPARSTR